MKKYISIILIAVMLIAVLCGCNKQLIDTTYNFNRAIIELPNGEVIDGQIQSWGDYENSDQIQVKIDGKTYLVHSSQITLIAE